MSFGIEFYRFLGALGTVLLIFLALKTSMKTQRGRRTGMDGLFTDDDRLKNSRGVTKITNKDNLCLARSVVVALAKLELQKIDREKNPEEWRHAQSRLTQLQNTQRNVQTREARQLHLNAGFRLNYTPSFTDIPSFERVTNAPNHCVQAWESRQTCVCR